MVRIVKLFLILNLLLQAGCDSNLNVKTSANETYQDGFGGSLALTILVADQVSNDPEFTASWNPGSEINSSAGFKFYVAGDAACENRSFSYEGILEHEKKLDFLNDGIYFLCLYGVAKNGEEIAADNNGLKVTLDRTPPSISMLESVSKRAAFQMQPSITDFLETSVVWEKVSGPGEVQFSQADNPQSSISMTVDGTYELRLNVSDAAGNHSSKNVTVYWDSTGPLFSSMVGANGASDGYINASESGSTAAIVTLNASNYSTADFTAILDDSPTITCDSGKTYSNTNIPFINTMPATDGVYVVCVKLTDAAGNITYGKSAQITRDTIVPSVNVGADLVKNASFTVNATVSGATSYQWSQQSCTPAATVTFGSATAEDTSVTVSTDAACVLRLTATDAAGNSAFDELNFTWDTVPPSVNAGVDFCGYQNIAKSIDATVTGATSYSWTQSAGPGSCSFGSPAAVDTTTTCDTTGSVTLSLSASDDAGNAASDTLTFTVHPGGSSGTADLCFGLQTTNFGTGDDRATTVVVQSDGKILMAGVSHNGTDQDAAFVRYNADGTLDTGFGTGGKVSVNFSGNESIQSLALQSDGKIVGVGTTNVGGASPDLLFIRLTTSGALDTTFSGDGVAALSSSVPIYGNTVGIQSDGAIVAGAEWHNGVNYDFGIARMTSAGALDTTFNGTGYRLLNFGSQDGVYDLKIQSDGNIVAAGYYANATPNFDFAIIRLLPTGALDPAFAGGSARAVPFGTGHDTPHGMAIQSDGKIVIAGDYVNGASRDLAIARLNTDGSLDTTFDGDGKAVVPIASTAEQREHVAVQSDGKIVIVASASNGTDSDFLLVRLNSNGSLDTTFSGDGLALFDFGGTEVGNDLAFDANGDIIVTGSTSTVGGGAVGWLKVIK